jgi:ABC-type sugar transport system ATPase subunit
MSGAASPGIAIRGLHKRYGSTIALNGIDLDIRPGEVLGVAGPNGAGKSTLVRIIAGEESADSGGLTFGGLPWSPIADWRTVAVVHQEPQLFPNLSVAENVLVGREGSRTGLPRLGAADAAVMQALQIGHLAAKLLGDCTLATQQRTEIARAIARDARIFLFDEPNSALTDEESDELFREMAKIAATGRIVVLVTHRLGDLVEHADRVAIIRDGRVRATLEAADLTEESIARQLVVDSGADTSAKSAAAAAAARAKHPIVEVRGWSHGEVFRDVALTARPGEIIALMGVEGSGARELLRSFGGLERCLGTIEIAGQTGDAAKRSTAYVPATRLFSLYGNLSVGENLLVRLGRPEIAGFAMALKRKRMRELAVAAVTRFQIKAWNIAQSIRSLSGGNQQKVAIAQALHRNPRLLLLEEPTRGVDIRSKREIYRLLHDYVKEGNVAIMFCTEVLEVYEAADRAFVVAEGSLSREILIHEYDHIERLATDITRLERHHRTAEVVAAA